MTAADIRKHAEDLRQKALARGLELIKAIDIKKVFKLENTTYYSHGPGSATVKVDNGYEVRYREETRTAAVYLTDEKIEMSEAKWKKYLEEKRAAREELLKEMAQDEAEIKRLQKFLADKKERAHGIIPWTY